MKVDCLLGFELFVREMSRRNSREGGRRVFGRMWYLDVNNGL